MRWPELPAISSRMNMVASISKCQTQSGRQAALCGLFARRALPVSLAGALLCLGCLQEQGVLAQQSWLLAQVPTPPRRPAHLGASEPANAPPPPTAQPTITRSRPQQQPAEVQKPAAPEAPYHPMTAPGSMTERRAGIRACTEEWQKMKKAGTTGTMLWRDFSMECLTRKR